MVFKYSLQTGEWTQSDYLSAYIQIFTEMWRWVLKIILLEWRLCEIEHGIFTYIHPNIFYVCIYKPFIHTNKRIKI